MTTRTSLSFLLNTMLVGTRLMMIDGSGAKDKMMSTLWSTIIQEDDTRFNMNLIGKLINHFSL